MANIDVYLAAILSAVYGEDVRGSIHDAIEIINDVSEVVLSTGTAVTDPTSSSEGFFTGSLYLNLNTYELWKCTGTNTWVSQGILKGDDGDPGPAGANGNKWYIGTGISGKAVNPTVYSGSGVANANANDCYLNNSEGAVYHCVLGGDPTVATWVYDFTMTGGGGGGSYTAGNGITISVADVISIDPGTIANGNTKPVTGGDVYTALQGKADVGSVPSDLDDLSDVDINSPVNGQILEYDENNHTWKNAENVSSFAKYGGSLTFAQLTSSLLTAANEDKFFLVTDGGTISSADAGNWILPAMSVIPADSHIAVVNVGTSAVPSYKFDDFGGYVDLSGLAEKTELDGWTATAQVQSDNTVTFSGLNDAYGYELFCQDKLLGVSAMTKTGSGTAVTLVYTVTGGASGDVCKLRIVK